MPWHPRAQGKRNEDVTPTISASGSGRGRTPSRRAIRVGTGLPIAAGALDRRDRCRRCPRFAGTSDRSTAVGTAWTAVRGREPSRRRHQCRHRSGGSRAGGRLHAPRRQLQGTRTTQRSTRSSTSISSATSRRSPESLARPAYCWCIRRFQPQLFPSSSPTPSPIAASSIWRPPGSGPGRICMASSSR